ncbi:hypothetical protein G9464_07430 [Halostella sp. JP-L12]|uniref:Mut7-C RNAse domain-containing protein n=1 Tax=Halostella TaxID=1843185 RepID=UPI000EF84B69|nr:MULTISPECIES: Mut7-C RNAse domain-containing protein [Halostella]NHN47425.1 hypothetical protein [Halostella sp. JP-L12]
MDLLLDVMCGGIRSQLRMCGHDAAYALDRGVEDDDRLLAVAGEEGRTLVTRDAALARRADDAVLLEATDPADQLGELADAGIHLSLADEPERCGACNGRLKRAEPPTPDYAPDPEEERTWQCADCGQCFWKGNHWGRVAETLASL